MALPTSSLYCSDEDLAIRAGADFPALVPGDQLLAAGNDGAFDGAARWTLTSASCDFAAQGVAAGMVCLLATGRRDGAVPDVQQLAVDSVGEPGLVLRRKGQASGAGQPPGTAAGLSGVKFTVATLAPQIQRASFDLNRRYGVDDLVTGRRTSDLYDPTELQEACVLSVLYRAYQAISRKAGSDAPGGGADNFWAKALELKRELDELLDRVALHWQPADPAAAATPATTRFATRISR